MTPSAALISVSETLVLLDGQFLPVAEGVAEDKYALWLGSGISFNRVPGLKKLVPKVLEHLRSRIVPGDPDCRFLRALNSSLDLAVLSAGERARVDIGAAVATWPDLDLISTRLVDKYSAFLNVHVTGELDDFLLWDAIDVRATYANPALQPDVEHLSIAILVLEGVATSIATANWDGLVEKAVSALSGADQCVVSVRAEDLQQGPKRTHIYKFHGCAVKAAADEARYRPYLVARSPQITGWTSHPENLAIANRLVDVVGSKPTLMLGLSAQDANIQSLYAKAQATNPWAWPGERPSIVFSENAIGNLQEALLQNIYRNALTPTTRAQIVDGAVIRAFSSQLLTALVLHVLGSKLAALLEVAAGSLPQVERAALKEGIVSLRNFIADIAHPDRLKFVIELVEQSSRVKSLFRDGTVGAPPRKYDPLTTVPKHLISSDLGLPASGLGEAAIALALIGLGIRDAGWALSAADQATAESGSFTLVAGGNSAAFVLANNSQSSIQLRKNGHISDNADMVVIYSAEIPPSFARSPMAPPGRTGKPSLRELSVRELLVGATDTTELMRSFRSGVSL